MFLLLYFVELYCWSCNFFFFFCWSCNLSASYRSLYDVCFYFYNYLNLLTKTLVYKKKNQVIVYMILFDNMIYVSIISSLSPHQNLHQIIQMQVYMPIRSISIHTHTQSQSVLSLAQTRKPSSLSLTGFYSSLVPLCSFFLHLRSGAIPTFTSLVAAIYHFTCFN